ncbi:class I SAM-dependent methyltransferase [Desulfocurvus sp. DL9XJH121]
MPRPVENPGRDLDRQAAYWDRAAESKTFSHPLRMEGFQELVPATEPVLDYGCGYGRTCAHLRDHGYAHVVGVDISQRMIELGAQRHPGLDLRLMEHPRLPFPGESFAACTLLAMLTCVPGDAGQRAVQEEIHRVLRPGGVLYLSDYPLQQDQRNRRRYAEFEEEFGNYGVFRLADGAVVRHHRMEHILGLLAGFAVLRRETLDVPTMNGNPSRIVQILARKAGARLP